MKVVDEKGRIFGKLNIIDLLVIVLILAAIVVVGVKVLGGASTQDDQKAPETVTTQLTYTVRVTAQSGEAVEQVAEYVDAASGKRDQLMANGKMVDGYVVDYWTQPSRYNRLSTGSIELLDPEEAAEAGLVDVYFLIEAIVEIEVPENAIDEKTGEETGGVENVVMTCLVGTQEVRVGKPHIVKTTHLEFGYGIIESCVWEPVE